MFDCRSNVSKRVYASYRKQNFLIYILATFLGIVVLHYSHRFFDRDWDFSFLVNPSTSRPYGRITANKPAGYVFYALTDEYYWFFKSLFFSHFYPLRHSKLATRRPVWISSFPYSHRCFSTEIRSGTRHGRVRFMIGFAPSTNKIRS